MGEHLAVHYKPGTGNPLPSESEAVALWGQEQGPTLLRNIGKRLNKVEKIAAKKRKEFVLG